MSESNLEKTTVKKMKTYAFKINLGARSFTIQIDATSYGAASNVVFGRFPSSAIISPVN